MMEAWLKTLVEAHNPKQGQVRSLAQAFRKEAPAVLVLAATAWVQKEEAWPRPMDFWPYVKESAVAQAHIMATSDKKAHDQVKAKVVQRGGKIRPGAEVPGPTLEMGDKKVQTFFQAEEGPSGQPLMAQVMEAGHPALKALEEGLKTTDKVMGTLMNLAMKHEVKLADLMTLVVITAGVAGTSQEVVAVAILDKGLDPTIHVDHLVAVRGHSHNHTLGVAHDFGVALGIIEADVEGDDEK